MVNRQAVTAIQQQTAATNQLNQATQGQTHVQAGLTNSFIKGNLAARAISVGYMTLKNTMADMITTGIEFQFTMAKISAIGGESLESNRALEISIRQMALTSMKSAPEIAKVALEMGKLGLTSSQVNTLIGSVTTLGVALDEDLVTTGETVVQILNTYGKSVNEGKKVSEQLAYTVAASALDLQKFGTAFSYVGGTAAVAGVKFEDLAGAMDYLSNAGIKSSTIGTQLRRIILTLSNENSDAAKAIGGTVNSLGGLIPALAKLNAVLPKDSDKRLAALDTMFGKTATSVAALLLRDTNAIQRFSDNTTAATDNLDRMGGIMDGTFKAALARNMNAWRELGMTIGESVGGPAKDLLNIMTKIVSTMALSNKTRDDFYSTPYKTQASVAKGAHFGDLRTLDEANLKTALAGIPGTDKDDAAAAAEALTKLEEQVKKLKTTFETLQGTVDIEELLGKTVDYEAYIGKLDALSKSFQKLGEMKEAASVLREMAKAQEELFEMRSLGSGDDLTGSSRMLDFQNAAAPGSWEDQNTANQLEIETAAWLKADDSMEKYAQTLGKIKQSQPNDKPQWLEDMNGGLIAVNFSAELVNDSFDIMSAYFVEGIFSDKKDPFKHISDAFGNMAKSIIADLVAMIAKVLVFRGIIALLGFIPGAQGAIPFVAAVGSASTGGYKFASGTDQMVDRPTMFMAGESGRERVQVTPRAKVGSSGGSKITVVIQGDVLDGAKFTEAVAMAEKKLNRSMV